MRNPIVLLGAAALALAACSGPSGRDVALAKTARYQGDKLALFAAMKQVTEEKHKLDQSDEIALTVVTKARWFTPEGIVSNWEPGDQQGAEPGVPNMTGRQRLEDRSISVALVVKLLPEGSNWVVHVEPIYVEFRQGRPNIDRLKPTDPSLPGWAHGKVDVLAFEINKALKAYEVRTPGGMPPPPTEPAPAATPAADPAAPPAGDGSAAPPS